MSKISNVPSHHFLPFRDNIRGGVLIDEAIGYQWHLATFLGRGINEWKIAQKRRVAGLPWRRRGSHESSRSRYFGHWHTASKRCSGNAELGHDFEEKKVSSRTRWVGSNLLCALQNGFPMSNRHIYAKVDDIGLAQS